MRIPTPSQAASYKASASKAGSANIVSNHENEPSTISTRMSTSKPKYSNSSKTAPNSEKEKGSEPNQTETNSVESLPLQLRQIKRNWDTTKVPKGNVLNRIKIFGGGDPGQTKSLLELDDPQQGLNNTGKTNPALRKRREMEREAQLERERELESRRKQVGRTNSYGFGNSLKAKHKSATKIQSLARMLLAQKVALRKVEKAIAKEKQNAQKEASQAEHERKTKAAIKIQAMTRSSLTRLRVCRMVEEMISNLIEEQKAEERRQRAQEEHEEAIANANAIGKDDEMLALAASGALSKEHREAAAAEFAEEETRKRQEAMDEKRKAIENEAALGRANRDLTAKEGEEQRLAAIELSESERKAKADAEAKAKRKAALVDRERRMKNMNLFVGPLPWGVALLPDWWMELAPHKLLQLDSISEEDNGESFEEWRSGNVLNASE